MHELQRFQVIKSEEQVKERGADFMVYKLKGASEFLNFWSETLTVSMMKTSGSVYMSSKDAFFTMGGQF